MTLLWVGRSGVKSAEGQEIYPFCKASRPALEPIQPIIQRVPAALWPGISRHWREGDHLAPSRTKIKHGLKCTARPVYAFMACIEKTVFNYLFIVYLMTHSASRPLNSLNAELNPIRHLLALVGAHHILHVSRIRVKAVEWLCYY